MLTTRVILITGGVAALLAVALGAFAAHALKSSVPAERLAAFQTGVEYQMFHALAVLLIAAISLHPAAAAGTALMLAAAMILLVGIVLFCGSLYLLVVTDTAKLGIITPFGGLAFLIGWCVFIVAVLKTEI